VTTTSARREQIAASLQDKEYRDLFVAEEIDAGLPFQIRAMRQARGWSQQELADRLEMTQEGVSRLESLNYGRFTLSTLKRLASAFDVALTVRFVPFSELVDWAADLSPAALAVPDFDHDPGLGHEIACAETNPPSGTPAGIPDEPPAAIGHTRQEPWRKSG
jgi:transcriptional regulator with XRE-family HTH domain